MSAELLPCPNPECNGRGVYYKRDYASDASFHIPCNTYCTRGPSKISPDLACEAWNSMPRALKWTTIGPGDDRCMEPGAYWAKSKRYESAEWSQPYILTVSQYGYWRNTYMMIAGPIPQPAEE